MISVVIHPDQVFDLEAARDVVGMKKSSLQREIRLRRLRYAKRGGRVLILGRWILEWIEAGEVTRRRREATADRRELQEV